MFDRKSSVQTILYSLCALVLVGSSCSFNAKSTNSTGSIDRNTTTSDTLKPKYLWFDAEANFERFSHQDSIRFYLDKALDAGFTDVVIDVKPIYGKVLYKSDIIPELNTVGDYSRTLDWDYLQYFIDEAKERDLRVTVSTTIFPAGNPKDRSGLVYEDSRWDGKTTIQYKPDGTFLDIRNDKSKVAAFLNPLDPDVRTFVFQMIEELVTNYDIDGYILDYCRYPDMESDFSDLSKISFEEYIGVELDNFPQDIYYYDEGERKLGKYGKEWIEFRAKIIHDYIKEAKRRIKAIKPSVKLEYWAASWYYSIYQNGQNWASKSYDTSLDAPWATTNYKNTGFAEHLDAFQIGTYLTDIYGMDNPESIEYGIDRGKKLIDNATKLYGTIYALNHKDNIDDAVYLCLRDSDGLMVFDIVQVIGFDLWDQIKEGIDRYKEESE